MSAFSEIDRLLKERHLLRHPFYVAWSEGSLSRETLQDYAGQYYQFESSFPRFVAAAYSQLVSPQDRRTLLENLIDEEGRSPTHPELWLDFAKALGLTKARVQSAPTRRPMEQLCSTYDSMTRLSPASAIGALYSYEAIFPEIAAEKSRGLRAYYGIREQKAHEFFRVHTGADVAHSRTERAILGRLMRADPSESLAATESVRRSLDAWWDFLSDFGM